MGGVWGGLVSLSKGLTTSVVTLAELKWLLKWGGLSLCVSYR